MRRPAAGETPANLDLAAFEVGERGERGEPRFGCRLGHDRAEEAARARVPRLLAMGQRGKAAATWPVRRTLERGLAEGRVRESGVDGIFDRGQQFVPLPRSNRPALHLER
jgi:hypothetical protein